MSADGSSFVYFRGLRLSNVKAFTAGTVLDLRLDGRPAPWTLIVGENGLGKTTLLQCLALLRPTLNVEQSERTAAPEPDRVEPALPIYDDEQLIALARVGEGLRVELEAARQPDQNLAFKESLVA
jgi:ABC-type branched-subunit amino acid transport system ATPase component